MPATTLAAPATRRQPKPSLIHSEPMTAAKSTDAEVARRAGEILDSFVRREKQRAFAAFADLAKHGEVDQAIERFVRRDEWEDEAACWKVLAELEDKLADLERQAYGKASRRPADRRVKVNLETLVISARLTLGGARRDLPRLILRFVHAGIFPGI